MCLIMPHMVWSVKSVLQQIITDISAEPGIFIYTLLRLLECIAYGFYVRLGIFSAADAVDGIAIGIQQQY